MAIGLDKLKAMSTNERHRTWRNAKRLSATRDDARALVALIESSGLDYKAGKRQSISIHGKIGVKMRKIIFSPEGEKAALAAQAQGLAPLAGLDPLLKATLGKDYGKDNEATTQAGYLVTDLMRQHGFEPTGRSRNLPAPSVAKSGLLFVKSSR